MVTSEDLSQRGWKLVTRAWAVQWVGRREMDQVNSVYTKLFLLNLSLRIIQFEKQSTYHPQSVFLGRD